MYNALGVVAQLVRASACHAEGRGFEPRQSRQYLHRHVTVFLFAPQKKTHQPMCVCINKTY